MNRKEQIERRALLISFVCVGLILIVIAIFLVNNKQEKEANNRIIIQSELSQSEILALNQALNLSYKTKQTYWRITDEFDNPAPFFDLYKIEKDYVGAFQAIFKQLLLTIPKDNTYKSTKSFLNLEKACEGMKIMEQDNLRNYNELLLQLENDKAKSFMLILIDRTSRNLEELRNCPG